MSEASANTELQRSGRTAAGLAGYAMHDADTAGRVHKESGHAYRGPFQRDRDRIIHCSAFRRMSYKTQVFTGEMGDYHRTRLTHTMEVASIGRTLGRALALNEDLIEALALLHDIGHPPFGHSGEDVLDAALQDVGGFNHNCQALRIVEHLEKRYVDFPGLNLSREVLGGQRVRCPGTDIDGSPLLEVQIVDAADSIAYDTHDADDALEVGLLNLDELLETPLWREAATRVHKRYTALSPKELRLAAIRELIDWLVSDVLDVSRETLAEHEIDSVAEVRSHGGLVRFSREVHEAKSHFEAHMYERVYRHPKVVQMRERAKAMLREMFELLVERSQRVPELAESEASTEAPFARVVGDYLAAMTDRTAYQRYQLLVSGAGA